MSTPAQGLASSVLELAPALGASLLPGVRTWGCRGEGRQSGPVGLSWDTFTLRELILCPAEPSPWMRAVSGQDGAPDPRTEGCVGMEGAWLGPGHPGVGCGSWAGCEPLRRSLGRAVRDGLLVTAPPHPHTHRGFWVPSGSQHPSLTGSMHSLSDLKPSPSVPPWPHPSKAEGVCPPPELGEAPVVPGNVLGLRAVRGVGGPDYPGLDCPAPPPAPVERRGRRGRGEGGADNGPGPGRWRLCPERARGRGRAWRRERAARLCPRSCWWSRRRARGRTR